MMANQKQTITVELPDRVVTLRPAGKATVAALKNPPRAIRPNDQAVRAMRFDILDRHIVDWSGDGLRQYQVGHARRLSNDDIDRLCRSLCGDQSGKKSSGSSTDSP